MRRELDLLGASLMGLVLTGGCRAVSVWESSSTARPIQGIPFYTKTAANKQTTTRLHTWQRVSLTVLLVYEDPGKPPKKEAAGGQVFDVSSAKRNDLANIRQKVLDFNGRASGDPLGEVRGIVQELQSISFDPDTLTLGSGRLMENTVEQIVLTDYSRRYYINSGAAWPGSTKLAAELAPDGTLSKADASAESKPGELATALSTIFPVSAAFSSLLKLDKDKAKTEGTLGVKAPVEIQLAISEMGFVDEYSLTIRDTTVHDFLPLESTMRGVSISRKPISAGKEEKKDESPKIGFQGSVTLPEVKKEEKPK